MNFFSKYENEKTESNFFSKYEAKDEPRRDLERPELVSIVDNKTIRPDYKTTDVIDLYTSKQKTPTLTSDVKSSDVFQQRQTFFDIEQKAKEEAEFKTRDRLVQSEKETLTGNIFGKKKLGDKLLGNTAENITKKMQDSKIVSAASAGMTKSVRGINEFANIIINKMPPTWFDTGIEKDIKGGLDEFFRVNDEVLGEVSNKYTENYLKDSNNFEKYALGAIDTFTQMIPTITATVASGGASLGAMIPFAASAAGSYKLEAQDRGMTEKQATNYGLIAGFLEGLTEYIPFGYATKIFGKGASAIIKKGLKAALPIFGWNTLKGITSNKI